MNQIDSGKGTLMQEWKRKGLHLSSLYIPFLYGFLSKETALMIIVPISVSFLFLDALRLFHKGWNIYVGRLFKGFMRNGEEERLTGSSYFLLGCCLSILLFSKPVAITSILIMIVSDSLAAMVGRRFGRTKIFDKTLEGSLSFLGSAAILVVISPGIPLLAGLLGALAAATTEALPIGLDDNLVVPLVAGGTITAFSGLSVG